MLQLGVTLKRTASFLLIFLTAFSAYLIFFDKNPYEVVELNFKNKKNTLDGKLILPSKRYDNVPVMIFVHGDGAMPYDAYGYYNSLWRALAKKGIASYSWSKAGVDDSSGNWQNQSMDDRAEEVISAISMLKEYKEINISKVGLIGFSQAGWVLPKVAKKSSLHDIIVLISPAVNWMEQGEFNSRNRLSKRGFSELEIKNILSENTKQTSLLSKLSYSEYLLSVKEGSSAISEDRFQFIKLNWQSDSQQELKNIKTPLLAVFGKDDENINITNSINIYKSELVSNNKDMSIKVFDNAQHALLKTEHFEEQNPGLWFLIKLWFLEDDAFVEGYNDLLVNWAYSRFYGQ